MSHITTEDSHSHLTPGMVLYRHLDHSETCTSLALRRHVYKDYDKDFKCHRFYPYVIGYNKPVGFWAVMGAAMTNYKSYPSIHYLWFDKLQIPDELKYEIYQYMFKYQFHISR